MDLTSLAIGLVGVAITVAGIVLLRPLDANAAERSVKGAGVKAEGRSRTSQ